MAEALPELEHLTDATGKKVGLEAACLAVFLSVFTILAHRSHTESVTLRNEESNEWAHYQAKRIRDSQLDLNSKLALLLAPKNPEAEKIVGEWTAKRNEYKKELDEIDQEARKKAALGIQVESKACYFDLAEGILDIALVLCSLYFLSRKLFLPLFCLAAGFAGVVLGAIGLFVH